MSRSEQHTCKVPPGTTSSFPDFVGLLMSFFSGDGAAFGTRGPAGEARGARPRSGPPTGPPEAQGILEWIR